MGLFSAPTSLKALLAGLRVDDATHLDYNRSGTTHRGSSGRRRLDSNVPHGPGAFAGGTSQATISQLEQGKRTLADAEAATFRALFAAPEVATAEVLSLEPPPEAPKKRGRKAKVPVATEAPADASADDHTTLSKNQLERHL